MHDPLIIQRLAELPPALRELAESDFPQAAAETLGQAIELTEGQTQILSNGFFLYLIFILDKDGLLSFLTEEAFIEAEQAISLIDAFLATLPEEIKDANFVNSQIQSNDVVAPSNHSGMYSSTQASILQNSPTPNDSARWGQV